MPIKVCVAGATGWAGSALAKAVHEAGPSAEPYVAGAMLTIRSVGSLTGLVRGLDSIMDLQ